MLYYEYEWVEQTTAKYDWHINELYHYLIDWFMHYWINQVIDYLNKSNNSLWLFVSYCLIFFDVIEHILDSNSPSFNLISLSQRTAVPPAPCAPVVPAVSGSIQELWKRTKKLTRWFQNSCGRYFYLVVEFWKITFCFVLLTMFFTCFLC